MGKSKKAKTKSSFADVEKAMKHKKQNPNKVNDAVIRTARKLVKKKAVIVLAGFGVYCAVVGLVINIGWLISLFKYIF